MEVTVILRLAALFLLVLPMSCTSLGEVLALRNVDFRIANVSNVKLAGINLARITSFDQLGLTDVAQLGAAALSNKMVLDFALVVEGTNPPDNAQARMVKLDWSLFLDGKETIQGVFDDKVAFPPGKPTNFPIAMRLDLLEFFDGGAEELVKLALSFTGADAGAGKLHLMGTPTINTALGPMEFPRPVTIYQH